MTLWRRGSIGAVMTLLVIMAISEQAHADDREVARKLFDTGRQLLKEGDWKAACTKFEASLALYEAVGTLMNFASCHEHDQRLATALSTYRRAQLLNRDTKGDERRKKVAAFLSGKEQKLKAAVPTLIIVVSEPPEGLRVTRNDGAIPVGALGEAIPVDPGEQRIAASAPGWQTAKKEVALAVGEHKRVQLALVPAPGGASSDQGASLVMPAILTGVGVAVLGVGIGFTINGVSAANELDTLCRGQFESCTLLTTPPGYDSPEQAIDSLNQGKNLGYYVGIPATVVGAVGAGAGAIWLYSRLNASADVGAARSVLLPTAHQRGAGLLWVGAF